MTLKAAVIGAGHFAYRMHIPVLAAHNAVTLDSVCRLGAKELKLIADEFGFAFATENWRDVLARDIDIAVISSPHDLHYEQARAFLEKGCHVLVEKPMTLNPDEAWDLVATADRAGRELLVAYGWNYKPGLEAMREMVAQIGQVEHVVCHMASFTRAIFTGGSLGQFRHVAIQPDRTTWEAPESGGGYAHGQLSHALGLLYWLTDLRASTVRAMTSDATSGIDLHDAAIVQFKNGATGVLSGSCAIPTGHGFEVDIRLYGTKGSVLLDIETERLTLKLPDGQSETASVPSGAWTYSCEGPATRLVEIALGGGANNSPGHVGARAVETLHALMASARTHGNEQQIRGNHWKANGS
ncbi:MAG: Gfo/Idh/MocA family oxidoreductase [Alphaproteobacteria bacterium]|nr:Gfo/Idh/MocA family oxidoreductase [Alphaproteobacteria bacterium]